MPASYRCHCQQSGLQKKENHVSLEKIMSNNPTFPQFLENGSILKGKGTIGTLGVCLIEHSKFSLGCVQYGYFTCG